MMANSFKCPFTVECHHNVVQYNVILHTALQWFRHYLDHSLYTQRTLPISPAIGCLLLGVSRKFTTPAIGCLLLGVSRKFTTLQWPHTVIRFSITIFCMQLYNNNSETYHQTFNISHTLGNKIVDHSVFVGASPVAAAPTASSFST